MTTRDTAAEPETAHRHDPNECSRCRTLVALGRDTEKALAEEAAAPALTAAALAEACKAEVGPWFDEGHEEGRFDAQVLADRILARLAPAAAEPAETTLTWTYRGRCPSCGAEISAELPYLAAHLAPEEKAHRG